MVSFGWVREPEPASWLEGYTLPENPTLGPKLRGFEPVYPWDRPWPIPIATMISIQSLQQPGRQGGDGAMFVLVVLVDVLGLCLGLYGIVALVRKKIGVGPRALIGRPAQFAGVACIGVGVLLLVANKFLVALALGSWP